MKIINTTEITVSFPFENTKKLKENVKLKNKKGNKQRTTQRGPRLFIFEDYNMSLLFFVNSASCTYGETSLYVQTVFFSLKKAQTRGCEEPLEESRTKEAYSNLFHVSGSPGKHQWLQSGKGLVANMDECASIRYCDNLVMFRYVTGVFIRLIVFSIICFMGLGKISW